MINIKAARDILARHGETYVLYELESIAGDAPDDIETTDTAYTDDEIDTLSEAINECDAIGKYGAGDLLLDVIIANKEGLRDE